MRWCAEDLGWDAALAILASYSTSGAVASQLPFGGKPAGATAPLTLYAFGYVLQHGYYVGYLTKGYRGASTGSRSLALIRQEPVLLLLTC